jgi:hypothetical protein
MQKGGLLTTLALLALIGAACGQQDKYLFSDTTRYVQLPFNDDNRIVFPAGKAVTLTPGELAELSDLLQETVAKHNRTTKSAAYRIGSLRKFYFQLVAFTNEKGEKQVWINALCDVAGTRWKDNLVDVQDGGNCYWQVRINLTQKTAGQVQVNGYA